MVLLYTPLYGMITILICHCILHDTLAGAAKKGEQLDPGGTSFVPGSRIAYCGPAT